jgi:hypothetical protein
MLRYLINKCRPSKHKVLSSLLSLLLLALALMTLWLGHFFKNSVQNTVEIREITIALPPPPTPAPPVQQEMVETTLTIEIQGTGASLPKIDVKQPIDPIKPDVPTLNNQNIKWQEIEVDWDAFDLNQLDELPKLLTPLQVTLPKSLRRKGIDKVLIKLDILIDTNGQVTLINIIENPYSELASSIQKLVNNSRFSAPSKDNEAVKARFIWPVEIKS